MRLQLYQTRKNQVDIRKWAEFRPFHTNVPQYSRKAASSNNLAHAREIYCGCLEPFGSSLTTIDPTKTLRVCIQNTQHSFQIYRDGIKISNIMDDISNLFVQMLSQLVRMSTG
jgi:hypothetical protein